MLRQWAGGNGPASITSSRRKYDAVDKEFRESHSVICGHGGTPCTKTR